MLTVDRQVARLSLVDFPSPVEPLERMRSPRRSTPRSPQSRRDLASTPAHRRSDADDATAAARRARARPTTPRSRELREAIRAHPCHGCDDREDHARWAERYHRLERETGQLEQRVESRTNTIARTFDRVCGLLESLGYLDGDEVTADGARLARIYTELDLLAAECLRDGLWSGLTRPSWPRACRRWSSSRAQSDDAGPPRLPGGRVRDVLAETSAAGDASTGSRATTGWRSCASPTSASPGRRYRWASGGALEAVLRDAGLPAGDFVRWAKQLVDLLGQVAQAAAGAAASGRTADRAVDAIRRGVVAYSSVG